MFGFHQFYNITYWHVYRLIWATNTDFEIPRNEVYATHRSRIIENGWDYLLWSHKFFRQRNELIQVINSVKNNKENAKSVSLFSAELDRRGIINKNICSILSVNAFPLKKKKKRLSCLNIYISNTRLLQTSVSKNSRFSRCPGSKSFHYQQFLLLKDLYFNVFILFAQHIGRCWMHVSASAPVSKLETLFIRQKTSKNKFRHFNFNSRATSYKFKRNAFN